MSRVEFSFSVEGRIHIVIFYKKIVRQFLKNFRKKYFKIRRFRENFVIEKDFHLSEREYCPESLEIEIASKNEAPGFVLRPEKELRRHLIPVEAFQF